MSSVTNQTPARFKPSKLVLMTDALMTYIIRFGGILVITAVLGIFVFIGIQIYPLFLSASVQEMETRQVKDDEYSILGLDEWSELPFLVSREGRLFFLDLQGGGNVREQSIPFEQMRTISAVSYLPEKQLLIFGSADGFFCVVKILYSRDFESGNKVVATLEAGPWFKIGPEGANVSKIAYNDGGDRKLAAAIMDQAGRHEVYAVELTQKRSLLGTGALEVGEQFHLTSQITGNPNQILVNGSTDGVVVSSTEGSVAYFYLDGDRLSLRQTFQPFGDLKDQDVSSMNFLLGDVSLVFTNPSGASRIFSLFVPKGGSERLFGLTHNMEPLKAGADFFFKSQRNKGYLTGDGKQVSLRYATTESIRWKKEMPFHVKLGALSGKNDRIVLLDENHTLHFYRLHDPHPEASFKALFGKLWYEGAAEPKYEWQSTGGSDEFEPKLSLVPLIVGSLKGTFYAMLFALPVALLAAIYASQFLQPSIRRIVKPTMEIMASLPSVVLGFLAALWLAPILETRVPSVLCIIIALPLSAAVMGWIFSMLPMRYRRHLNPGREFLIFMPVFLLACWGAWNLGPIVENIFFTVTDPVTGERIADFRRWWPAVTGTPFEQRNSMVVGFMMGFAVIPIVFTIAEDAMSNVPASLRAGSLALGASRWQTARRIVLPTAAAGIFSATIIGFGRAVGETMIVVMATGNTPIMDFNIFSGMRTLSANIAVELPEAPHHSTLYRTLFLGAMLLFLMTFLVNTVAEILRQRLREKFKTV